MKAIILAGGNGTRLHPLSLALPKPMAKLVDKPLLEHIIKLLKKNGVSEICMTLRYLPKIISDYFGDGSTWGVLLESRIEEKTLGTAGGIKACADFIGSENFIVISGDAACDLDLLQLEHFHRENNAEVTIALHKSENPLEYGLVMTDSEGRVTGFIEKPSRDRVYTDCVNTGIYVVSANVLNDIPDDTAFDFARDLFPKLLSENRKICALPLGGYWCDVGSCSAYLRANFDALSGRVKIDFEASEITKGVWSCETLNPNAIYHAPCYIGRGVSVQDGAVIGPFTVIGSGSTVMEGVHVRGSVVDGAFLGADCKVSGSIICKGARIGNNARVLEGSVAGENTQISSGCLISEGIRIWPDKHIPAGLKVHTNVISGMTRNTPLFEENGKIHGTANEGISPEFCLTLGSVSEFRQIGIAHSGGDYARILAESFACGAGSAGRNTLYFDAPAAATAAFAARSYGTGLTFFAEQKDKDITLWFFDCNGLPIGREDERRLESSVSLGSANSCNEVSGTKSIVGGTEELHISAVASVKRKRGDMGLNITVNGRSAASRILKGSLWRSGFEVRSYYGPSENIIPDCAFFGISPDGFTLSLIDEEGVSWDHGKLLTALAMCEFENGDGPLTLPYNAPSTADILASKLGGRLLRLGRDGEGAETLFLERPYASDAIFLAVRLASSLERYGNKFSDMMNKIPTYFTAARDIPFVYSRGQLMRGLGSYAADGSPELVSGIKFKARGGYAHITPGAENILRIRVEAENAEIAEEICVDIEKKVRELTNS